jgi:hypothetical protein
LSKIATSLKLGVQVGEMIPAMAGVQAPNVSSFLYDDVAVPPGLTFMDLYAAAQCVSHR